MFLKTYLVILVEIDGCRCACGCCRGISSGSAPFRDDQEPSDNFQGIFLLFFKEKGQNEILKYMNNKLKYMNYRLDWSWLILFYIRMYLPPWDSKKILPCHSEVLQWAMICLSWASQATDVEIMEPEAGSECCWTEKRMDVSWHWKNHSPWWTTQILQPFLYIYSILVTKGHMMWYNPFCIYMIQRVIALPNSVRVRVRQSDFAKGQKVRRGDSTAGLPNGVQLWIMG